MGIAYGNRARPGPITKAHATIALRLHLAPFERLLLEPLHKDFGQVSPTCSSVARHRRRSLAASIVTASKRRARALYAASAIALAVTETRGN